MQYRNDRSGNPLSTLGYGCMRFTTKGGKIDLDKAEKEIPSPFWATAACASPARRRGWT